jgi:hypothetical protein
MAKTADFAVLALSGMDVVLALHTAQDPLPEEWQHYVEHLDKLKRKTGGDMSKVRAVVISDGGSPNAKQRELMVLAAGAPVKLAGITNVLTNPVKRGIATAISWVNPEFKAMMPRDWRDALRHVNLEGQIQPLLFEFERLQRTLPPVQTLTQLVSETRRNVA